MDVYERLQVRTVINAFETVSIVGGTRIRPEALAAMQAAATSFVFLPAVYKDLQRTVCDGDWKLIRYYRPEEHNYGTDRVQLFHLSDDPWEVNDLSDDPSAREHLERLADELVTWQVRLDDPWAYRSPLPAVRQAGVWGNWND
jgi:arylsulfatase A-like enzyme